MNNNEKNILPKIWKGADDEDISCTEKIKILNENIVEIGPGYGSVTDKIILKKPN